MKLPFLSFRDCTQVVITTLLSVSLPLLAASSAHAAGSNMPWEQPLQQVLQSVEGPVAKRQPRPSVPLREEDIETLDDMMRKGQIDPSEV